MVHEFMESARLVNLDRTFERPRTLLATGCLAVALLLIAAWASAGEPWIERQDLFRSGDGGYAMYHIPGIAVTARGTVLAWAEARRTRGDWAAIDILLRRSTDGGRTWSDAHKVADVPGPKEKNPVALDLKNVKATDVTYNNPVFIADRDGGVSFLFCLEYCRAFAVAARTTGKHGASRSKSPRRSNRSARRIPGK